MGSGTIGLGGGDLVIESSGDSLATIEVMRRSYEWKTTADFDKGTKSANMDTSQGFLQLGNVTIKNIYLTHKTK